MKKKKQKPGTPTNSAYLTVLLRGSKEVTGENLWQNHYKVICKCHHLHLHYLYHHCLVLPVPDYIIDSPEISSTQTDEATI